MMRARTLAAAVVLVCVSVAPVRGQAPALPGWLCGAGEFEESWKAKELRDLASQLHDQYEQCMDQTGNAVFECHSRYIEKRDKLWEEASRLERIASSRSAECRRRASAEKKKERERKQAERRARAGGSPLQKRVLSGLEARLKKDHPNLYKLYKAGNITHGFAQLSDASKPFDQRFDAVARIMTNWHDLARNPSAADRHRIRESLDAYKKIAGEAIDSFERQMRDGASRYASYEQAIGRIEEGLRDEGERRARQATTAAEEPELPAEVQPAPQPAPQPSYRDRVSTFCNGHAGCLYCYGGGPDPGNFSCLSSSLESLCATHRSNVAQGRVNSEVLNIVKSCERAGL